MTAKSQLNSVETARLARISRLAAVMAAVIFLVLATLIGRNVLRLGELETQIAQRKTTITTLEDSASALKNEIYALRYSPDDRIDVRAHAEAIPGIMESGKQVKDFTI